MYWRMYLAAIGCWGDLKNQFGCVPSSGVIGELGVKGINASEKF